MSSSTNVMPKQTTGMSGAPTTSTETTGVLSGGRRHGVTVKTLKSMLKKAGLKTTGRKAALTRRVKKAHLKGGNVTGDMNVNKEETMGGRKRRGTKGKLFGVKLY